MSNSPRIVTIVQARRGSSRLPDKVLLPLCGEPLLVRMVDRVRAAKRTGTVVVATTTNPEDDALVSLMEARGVYVFRGHPSDLLDRHVRAARAFGAEVVAKIPSDCPLISPSIIDRVIGAFLRSSGWDYVSNLHPASYPDGNDVEIMSFSALETAWREAARPFEREHTTPFLWDNPDRFRIGNAAWERGLDYSMSHRWTIDYEDDYRFIRTVYNALFPRNPLFGLEEILTLLEERPGLADLNRRWAGVNWYRHHLGELKTIGPDQTRITEERN
jgi:spore coat polysaccharide biosynthesis protein SpsF